jgi:hypothetical protein
MALAAGLYVVLMLGIVVSLGFMYLLVIIIANTRMFRPTPREIAFLGVFLFLIGVTLGLLIGSVMLLAAVTTSLAVIFALFLFVGRLRHWREDLRRGRALRKEGIKTTAEANNMRR